MTKELNDDLDAVRVVVSTLEKFDAADKERILRWAREKLGLGPAAAAPAGSGAIPGNAASPPTTTTGSHPAVAAPESRPRDIKTFVSLKKPKTDNQFTATVAYYYRFEAPEDARKDSITPQDIQEACRQSGRNRMSRPAQSLVNAHKQGYLDKGPERGTYVINTVGENLVAMTLPDGDIGSIKKAPRKAAKK